MYLYLYLYPRINEDTNKCMKKNVARYFSDAENKY